MYFPFLANSILTTMVLTHIPFSTCSRDPDPDTVKGCNVVKLDEDLGSLGARSLKTINHDLTKLKIPVRFDSREKWPYCTSIRTIFNQGSCGGCWAFVTGSVMSDRMCIATKGKFNEFISIQDLLECCNDCINNLQELRGGCKGGIAWRSFQKWEKEGVVTMNCKPLGSGIQDGYPIRKCRKFCPKSGKYQNDQQFSENTIVIAPQLGIRDMRQVQAEIMINGPVAGGIDAYNYMKKIKTKTILRFDPRLVREGEEADPHAIKLMGWDVINGTKVWIIANSWGKNWCYYGFCYIRRGQNDFSLENKTISAGMPEKWAKGKRRTAAGCGRNFGGKIWVVLPGFCIILIGRY